MINKVNELKNLFLSHKAATSAIISAILTTGLVYSLGLLWSQSYLLLGIIWFGLYHVVLEALKNLSRRRIIFSLIFSLPFSFLFLLGTKIGYPDGAFMGFKPLDLVPFGALFGICLAGFVAFLGTIDKNAFTPSKTNALEQKKRLKQWFIFSGILFVCWLPIFLSYFPGGVSVDSAVEIRQAIGESVWSNWHPVLHVFFLAIIINPVRWLTGSLTAGIAVSVITQMILFAIILGYAACWIIKKTSRNYIGYLLLAFFALCPIIACYSVTIWKDILFSGVFLLLFIKLCELITLSRDKKLSLKTTLLVLVFSLLSAFLRNGGVFVIIVLACILIIYFKRSRMLLSLAFGTLIVFTALIQGPGYKLLGIASSPFMESMSVPAQQLAYTVKNGGLSEGEYAQLSEFANPEALAEKYEPMNADPVKGVFYITNIVEEKKAEFLKLWFSVLRHNFWNYVKAYILHTYSYWYIEGPSWAIDLSHVHDDVWMEADFNDYKVLGDVIYKLVHHTEMGNTRAVWGSWMASVGFMCWWLVVSIIVFIYKKRYKMLIPLSIVVVYIGLLLVASPISWIFRYVFSLLLIMPVSTVLFFVKIEERKNHD
ncbi:hypothetical protein IJH27_00540 [Candidatus Saccharibacteria bacterium]|nr:hypothetical protein [Candidatus Saccharibacteria bacterium]